MKTQAAHSVLGGLKSCWQIQNKSLVALTLKKCETSALRSVAALMLQGSLTPHRFEWISLLEKTA